ncbi:uncharacterized protein LOC108681248 [Hyalella azteca]|uniref:Uncharacterized protein LOC108681248 n=1 Tax=Hyalella azteca TaxID=294128 RepID=A0A979FVY5_HYAAZ|nr:uncharacterized protein LOC108681248 [Hyalella azteca]
MANLCLKTCGRCVGSVDKEPDPYSSDYPAVLVDYDVYYAMQGFTDPDAQTDNQKEFDDSSVEAIEFIRKSLEVEDDSSDAKPNFADIKPLPHPSVSGYVPHTTSADLVTDSDGGYRSDLRLDVEFLDFDSFLRRTNSSQDQILSKRSMPVDNIKFITHFIRQLRGTVPDSASLQRSLYRLNRIVTFYEGRQDPRFVQEVVNYFVAPQRDRNTVANSQQDFLDSLISYRTVPPSAP